MFDEPLDEVGVASGRGPVEASATRFVDAFDQAAVGNILVGKCKCTHNDFKADATF